MSPSTSNAHRERAGTALRKRVSGPPLPSIPVISQGDSFPRKSSGEDKEHKLPHSLTTGRLLGPKTVLRIESKAALDPFQLSDTGAVGAYRSVAKFS